MTAPADPRQAAGPPRVSLCVGDESSLGPLARVLAASLPATAFLALDGDLGAGKTTFTKALAAAAGIDPTDVVSPTFGLVHIHPLPAGHPAEQLVHADLYRLAGPQDLVELGWDEIVAGPGWVVAEWATRIADSLPEERLDVGIVIESETGRRFEIRCRGVRHRAVIERLRALPGASID
ncbi:MAG: tRNA (adenosine(37)-N6)-threonylcarbamoyltransferase complex ATPase subunit type 1 TsaE [Planctomycetota bacterium]|nr:MAG: tRNA (adenosine(37)-N6)-threonylcarbamoyltransferase complex ATPase subunit type 1 TsaE [Planctomycetota bacterium]